ncbi:NADP-dependent oxidoreductase [Sulfitobacter donghicola]|uniref:2-alkenal reductase n=1 Tax=Sulfitobacter donghicola DSW-25 = KCTC 12864 = JCM 14565 TaxID=1300350 RepID=A0A073II27_9RHOB|nr:NADP-dependent oxidoreductase [Sulfitobacter donghicola]KEJ89215.1 2-alkenal reductase [Sulfitobacter donghicola DSW-25 = KCTC 12864 = JCM 14565]KIN69007.1 Quinone oxidoreductase [Sulfitobacter donghicola DSW-25 = KCTC 12864 = JCM 14565]
MTETMKQIALASRPKGAPTPENFRLEELPIPTPAEGEVLVRVHYMSLDPYMRGRMDDSKSYAANIPVDGKMEGGSVGEIIASNAEGYAVGEFVMGGFGWATHAAVPAVGLAKVDPKVTPITYSLGVLGMPGFTGWLGLMEFGKPKAGETLVVAAATGPVGSMVGQVAKSLGLRTVGIAGGPEKCKMAVEQFGFDECLDHHAYDSADALRDDLGKACPDGIDIYFENVGGKVLEAVLPLMNLFGRIPLCGMIAWYNETKEVDAGLTGQQIWRHALVQSLSINGFIISNYWDRMGDFHKAVGPMIASGAVAVQEDITEGLENAPDAFIKLLTGGNTGKAMVKVI